MSNHARFQRNQKVTANNHPMVWTVSHPRPDENNVVGVRSTSGSYSWLDQDLLKPVMPAMQLTVEWKVPTPGQYVLHQNSDGTWHIMPSRFAGGASSAFVITNITDKDNT